MSIPLLSIALAAAAQSPGQLHQWVGPENSLHGLALDGAGDVNQDGIPDVIVGAREAWVNGSIRNGEALVYSGADFSVLHRFDGPAERDAWLGEAVAGVGDLNQDGYDDVVVGASNTTPYGTVWAFSGFDGSILYTWNGEQTGGFGDNFGWRVSAAGDVNQDGVPDVLIAANQADVGGISRAGRIYVYSGADGSQLHRIDGTASAMTLGRDISEAGDVNQDGYGDVIAGGEQIARVFSGFDGSVLFEWTSSDDDFGVSVSIAGDLNQDGYPDQLVGAFNALEFGKRKGRARCYSGLDGTILYTWTGPGAETRGFGYSVSDAGDLNGDGVEDVLIGAQYSSWNGYDTGSVFAHSGADGSVLERWDGDDTLDRFGVAVAGPGDVDQDGLDDVLVGAYLSDANGFNSGASYLYSGITGAPDLRVLELEQDELVTVEASNCTPGGLVYVAYSLVGAGPVSTPFGPGYVSPPYTLVTLTANGSGVAQFTAVVPSNTEGIPVWFHGVDVAAGTMLNPIATKIRR